MRESWNSSPGRSAAARATRWSIASRRTSQSTILVYGLSRSRASPLSSVSPDCRRRPAVEHWGHGYATEAAQLALGHGFETVGLSEIVSFTAATNRRSRAVMERLCMQRNPADDLDYPSLPDGHPLRRHVLYRLSRRRSR